MGKLRSRVIKTSVPGIRLELRADDSYAVSFDFHPVSVDGWEMAKQLPTLARQAIREHKALQARMRRIHHLYRRRRVGR